MGFSVTAGLILALVISAMSASRTCRVAALVGLVWSEILGFGFVAPAIIATHRLRPETAYQWLLIDSVILAALLLVGIFVVALSVAPLAAGWFLRRFEWDRPLFPATLWSIATVPLAYLVLSAYVEWANFARPPALNSFRPVIGYAFLVSGALSATFLALARFSSTDARRHRVILTTTVCACLALPGQFLFVAPRVDEPRQYPLLESGPRHGKIRPLLMVGLDGGNWRTLGPLIAAGRVPTFASMTTHGIRGDMDAIWPPFWSTPAWGAILTGHRREEFDVYEDMAAFAPGIPPFELPLTLDARLNPMYEVEFGLMRVGLIEAAPVAREQLKRMPIWTRLSRSGVRTAVVRFPYTYPATRQADYVVSNRVTTDLWGRTLGVRTGDRDAVLYSRQRIPQLEGLFSGDQRATMDDVKRILPEFGTVRPADALINPGDVLQQVLGIEDRMVDAAVSIVRQDPEVEVLMIHMTGFDSICHAYWQYRFPDDFPEDRPDAEMVRILGPVVDRYLEYVDSQVARLIRSFPVQPNVLVVSDHGEEASRQYPMWKGWHSRKGIFLAGGPDIDHRANPVRVQYGDVAPTMLDLLMIPTPIDLKGMSVVTHPAGSRE